MFFGGGEVPGHRTLLANAGVEAVSLSFIGLTRRIKHLDRFSLTEKFPDPKQEVFLDSGAYSLNKEDSTFSDAQAEDLYNQYLEFITANMRRITMFSEFDALQLGPDFRADIRYSLVSEGGAMFLPIWHAVDGVDELKNLAEEYGRVGILQMEAEALTTISPLLNTLADQGVKLHGVAMTQMASMKRVRWDSVGSTSWLSPSQYGDTFVWTGKELKRYPKSYKDESRKRHRTLFTSNGFDAEKIANDDVSEVLRLSVWSWTQFVDDINRHGVTPLDDSAVSANVEDPGQEVDMAGNFGGNGELVPSSRPRVLLPVLSVNDVFVEKDGKPEQQTGLGTSNLMQCSSCFLAKKCPQFRPGEECVFDIPVMVKTRTQVTALRKAILAMQAQRVMTMRMMEQVEGGYADPNLSAEVRILWKMMQDDEAADKAGFTLEIKASGDGNAGFMSRMFGEQVADQVNALEAPVRTQDVAREAGIWDAEVVSAEEGV